MLDPLLARVSELLNDPAIAIAAGSAQHALASITQKNPGLQRECEEFVRRVGSLVTADCACGASSLARSTIGLAGVLAGYIGARGDATTVAWCEIAFFVRAMIATVDSDLRIHQAPEGHA